MTPFECARSLVAHIVEEARHQGWDMRPCLQAFDATDDVAIITHQHEKPYRNKKPEGVATCLTYARAILGDEHGSDFNNPQRSPRPEQLPFHTTK